MKQLFHKKGLVNPFDIASRFGYYMIVLMIISVLFLFFAVLIRGSQVEFYKNSFGTDIIGFEDRFFQHISYKDPVTQRTYLKVIDVNLMRNILAGAEDKNSYYMDFHDALGIYSPDDRRALQVEFFVSEESDTFILFQTMNFQSRSASFKKMYPVVFKQGSILIPGFIVLTFERM